MKAFLLIIFSSSVLFSIEYDNLVDEDKDYERIYADKLEEICYTLKSLDKKMNTLISFYSHEFHHVGSKRGAEEDLLKHDLIQETN